MVCADGSAIEGFEALLRWQHPELGNVGPARFVPVAEEARLIGPIGEWLLRSACEEAMRWPETVRISVNVSAEHLTNPNFLSVVISSLAHSRLPADRLELEVTESVFIREGTNAVAVLEQLMTLGIRLAIDDFGTGYSYQLVRRLGCRKVQGYLFGRPMAPADARALFEVSKRDVA